MAKKQLVLLAMVLILLCLVFAAVYLYKMGQQRESFQPSTAQEITVATLAKHDTPENCWIGQGSKVFNATSYVDRHPESELRTKCGKILEQDEKDLEKLFGQAYIGLLVP